MNLIPENQLFARIPYELSKKGVTKEEFIEWQSKRFPHCPKCGSSLSSTFNYCGKCGFLLPLPETIEGLGLREEEMKSRPHMDHNIQKQDKLNFCVDCGKSLR